MKRSSFLSAILFFFCNSIMFGQQSPEDFLGYEIGTQFTRHHRIMDYFREVSEKSPLVTFQEYGETYEGRPLTYAVISSEDNLKNITSIRTDHLKNAGVIPGVPGDPGKVAIVWMSYNVHGNEASSSEAAMLTLYELITTKQQWLENTVIIIDPAVNPDGRDRYVNWYKQVRAIPYNTEPMAIEHMEPWPGGRPNHYLFDLNRDWAWATQKETRQRLEIYNKWLPHIHVDFHEQGINDPYYFAPAAEPFHEIITPFQRKFQTEIGKNHARYFDQEGWLYFTKERFDLLYPSYGDTYPTYMGAIGMTYEQAGHGRAGLGIETSEGYILTLENRIAHHHKAGISTIEVAKENVAVLNTEFRKFFQRSKQANKNYVVKGDPGKMKSLQQLLDRHMIRYQTPSQEIVSGYHYSKMKNSKLRTDENTLVIPTGQPKGKMVKVLFEPSTKLEDSLTYDITAWSLPYAYGLEAVATSKDISLQKIKEKEIEVVSNIADPDGAGYLVTWKGMKDARFLVALLKEGIKVRFTETAITTENKDFQRGSLVITKSDNKKIQGFDQKLVELANYHQRELTAAGGFSTTGPDFGSSQVRFIKAPEIGVLRGEETSSLNYGEIWYFFEQELGYPITSIGTDYFDRFDLSELDILILPSGHYTDSLKVANVPRLSAWIKNGGKIIAMGNALEIFSGEKGFDLHKNEVEEDSLRVGNFVPYDQRERENIKEMITGSIVRTQIDNTHPMAFGYGNDYFSLKLSNDSYSYLQDGFNVGYLPEDPEIISGFAGSEAQKKISSSLVFGEKPMGAGTIIYMVDNPLFRGFWENGKLFFANAVFFVNNGG